MQDKWTGQSFNSHYSLRENSYHRKLAQLCCNKLAIVKFVQTSPYTILAYSVELVRTSHRGSHRQPTPLAFSLIHPPISHFPPSYSIAIDSQSIVYLPAIPRLTSSNQLQHLFQVNASPAKVSWPIPGPSIPLLCQPICSPIASWVLNFVEQFGKIVSRCKCDEVE